MFRKGSLVFVAFVVLLLGQAGFVAAENSAQESPTQENQAQETPPAVSLLEEKVNELLGTKYMWAGETEKGFDCSGFTLHVMKAFGVDLPHSSKAQATKGAKIKKDELRPGDLVFFNTDGKGISHVGIYLGDNKFAHSAIKVGVVVNDLDEKYYKTRYVSAARILSDEAFEKFAVVQVEEIEVDEDNN